MLTGKNDNAIKHIKPYQTCFKGIQSCHVLFQFWKPLCLFRPVSQPCGITSVFRLSSCRFQGRCCHRVCFWQKCDLYAYFKACLKSCRIHTTSIFVKGAHWSLLGLWPYEATHAMKPRFPQHTSIEERLIGMWDLWHNGLWPHETKSSWSPLTVRQSPTVPLQRGPPSTQARIVARYHVEKRSFDRWPTS